MGTIVDTSKEHGRMLAVNVFRNLKTPYT